MKREKNIEEFSKYVMKEAKTNSPSKDFVANVMEVIETDFEAATGLKYQPLISKKGWLMVAVLFVAVCVFIYTGNFETPELLSSIDLSFLNKIPSFNLFESINVSNTFLVSILLFAIFAMLQLLTIKNIFNKQLMS